MALRLVLAGYLIGKVQRTTQADGTTVIAVRIDPPSAPSERFSVAKALLEPVAVYVELADLKISARAETGAIPIPVLVLGGVVAVSIVVAQAYVATVVLEKAGEIVDGALKRNAASSEVQRADAEVLKLVNNHVQREQAAGQTMPLDPATHIALTGLQARTSQTLSAAYQRADEKSSFPPWTLPAAGLAAAAALAAFFAVKGHKRGKPK